MVTLNQYTPTAHSRILGLGASRPDVTVTNDDICQWIESSDEWIRQRTGIVTRHRADESTSALDLALEAAPARVRIGAREANVQAFNGSLPGPTLRVRGGDTIRVAMRNGLDAPTNLHAHGLHVSPEDNGDNPFVSIDPGTPSTTTSPFRRTTRPAPPGTTRPGTGTGPTSSRRVSTGPSSSRTPTPCPWPGTGCWWSPTSPSTTPGTWPRSPRRSG